VGNNHFGAHLKRSLKLIQQIIEDPPII